MAEDEATTKRAIDRFRLRHDAAVENLERANTWDALHGTDTADEYQREEQDIWDEWVDYVEEHELNYTEHDPRTPSGMEEG